MVKSELEREVDSPVPDESLQRAMRRVNAALRRLIKSCDAEIELVSAASETPPECGQKLAETEKDGYQYILLKVPLDPLTELTARQREIALSAAVGMSNKEVGNRLQISHETVASHLRLIYKKLKVDCRSRLFRRVLGPGRLTHIPQR